MNIKQKMADAMIKTTSYGDYSVDDMLEAALSVAADPANWPNYKHDIKVRDIFAAVINHIKGLPS